MAQFALRQMMKKMDAVERGQFVRHLRILLAENKSRMLSGYELRDLMKSRFGWDAHQSSISRVISKFKLDKLFLCNFPAKPGVPIGKGAVCRVSGCVPDVVVRERFRALYDAVVVADGRYPTGRQ